MGSGFSLAVGIFAAVVLLALVLKLLSKIRITR
jgi:hypothetical protein